MCGGCFDFFAQVLLNGGYGTANASTNEPVTPHTVFQIGSITKIFTTLMMMKLVGDGAVSLDDRVGKYYNEQNPPVYDHHHPRVLCDVSRVDEYGSYSVRNPMTGNTEYSDTSLAMLSTHTSGLPRESPCGVYIPSQVSSPSPPLSSKGREEID